MRGYCGIGIVHGKADVNIGTLLRSAQSFGAHFVFTIGRRYTRQSSDTGKALRHLPVLHFTTLDDLVAHLPLGCRLVGVELGNGARPLGPYVHPRCACYLLGAEDHGLTADAIARCDELVEIEGGTYCLNVAVAGSILLYDRARKRAVTTQNQAHHRLERVASVSRAASPL